MKGVMGVLLSAPERATSSHDFVVQYSIPVPDSRPPSPSYGVLTRWALCDTVQPQPHVPLFTTMTNYIPSCGAGEK